MSNQQLQEYISGQLKQGVDVANIKKILLEQGWEVGDVETALVEAQSVSPIPSSALSRTQLPSIGDTIAETWSIWTQKIVALLGIAAIPVVIGIVSDLTGMLVVAGVALFIFFIVSIWSQLAMIYVIGGIQEDIGVVEAYTRAAKKVWSGLGAIILMAVVVVAGMMLFVIPGIIAMIVFSFFMYVLVIEDETASRSLLKSQKYVSGNWWGVFIRIVISMIPVALVVILFGYISSLFEETVAGGSIENSITILYSIWDMAISSFLLVYGFVIYKYLKEIKGQVNLTSKGFSMWYVVVSVVIIGLGLVVATWAFSVYIDKVSSSNDYFNSQLLDKKDGIYNEADTIDTDSTDTNNDAQYAIQKFLLNDQVSSIVASDGGSYPMQWDAIDSVTGEPYQYQQLNGGQEFELCTNLKSTNKPLCMTQDDFVKEVQ